MAKQDPHGHPGYERTDAVAWATIRAGLYILAVMFLTAAVLVPMYRLLIRREAAAQGEPVTLVKPQAAPAEPAFPKLVTSEPAVLAELRVQEDDLLTGWGWVEKDRGVARMPVDEAMKIVAERGLPRFPAPPPAPGTAPTPRATPATGATPAPAAAAPTGGVR